MVTKLPNRIRKLREERSWSQADLAEKANAHWVTISKLERGKIKLTTEWMDRLASVFCVEPLTLLAEPAKPELITIAGTIDWGGAFNHLIGADDVTATLTMEFELGEKPSQSSIWANVIADQFHPFLHNGDLVRFTFSQYLDHASYIGRLCLVLVSEDRTQGQIGYLNPSIAKGSYRLDVPGQPPTLIDRFHAIGVASMAIFKAQVTPAEALKTARLEATADADDESGS